MASYENGPGQKFAAASGSGTNADPFVPSMALAAGTASTTIGATTDAGPAWTTVLGVSGVPVASANASGGIDVSAAPATGLKIRLVDLILTNRTAAAMEFTFTTETSGTVVCGPYSVPANGTLQVTPRSWGWKTDTAVKKLRCTTSATGNVSIEPYYFYEA